MNKEGYEYTIKEDKDGCFLRARSSSAGKHFSDFRTYTKRYPNGQETQVSLNKATIEKILDKVKIKSLSECFVFEVDENGTQLYKYWRQIRLSLANFQEAIRDGIFQYYSGDNDFAPSLLIPLSILFNHKQK